MKVLISLTTIFLFLASYAQADSRDYFKNNTLPSKYPQLLQYLKINKTLKVSWLSQTGENQSQTLELTNDGVVVIKTKMYAGPASDMNTPVDIIMADKNKDHRLDTIEYHMQGQKPHILDSPTDDSSLFLWDTALAITIKYSQCCSK